MAIVHRIARKPAAVQSLIKKETKKKVNKECVGRGLAKAKRERTAPTNF